MRDALTTEQRLMLDCLCTRHHDGRVRERYAREVAPSSEQWVAPFVLYLLGEYVVEVIEAVAASVPRTDAVTANYAQFCAENADFVQLVEARAISYWNCYYRQRFPDRNAYPAVPALRRLCGGSVANSA
jgi:hypothetical protein